MKCPFELAGAVLTPTSFQMEVRAFCATAANPALSRDDKRRAYGAIVHHAAMFDPSDAGFANIGVALHDACRMWLDVAAAPTH